VNAHAGQLWLCDQNGNYHNIQSWHNRDVAETVQADSSFIGFLVEKKFVINLLEIESHKEEYEGLSLPGIIDQIDRAWLIIPLFYEEQLLGFILLTNPLVVRPINWEDRDLLKTAAKQIASYLKVMMTSSQLAENKQFEVFSRLSAFMVHDLKNVAAELELVAKNSKKFADNPEFVSDAFDTVDNTSKDIKRILKQLRHRYSMDEKNTLIDLISVLQDVVNERKILSPEPVFHSDHESVMVSINRSRLTNVLAHLIENAQQATDESGEITVSVSTMDQICVIKIRDNGQGMSKDFIRNRLFKPFDTTKGNAGMGIGMYESREFMRQMGGEIVVESEPGEGSTIILKIPLTQTDTAVAEYGDRAE
jgi:putative PEP-CTERM system histidine kinase